MCSAGSIAVISSVPSFFVRRRRSNLSPPSLRLCPTRMGPSHSYLPRNSMSTFCIMPNAARIELASLKRRPPSLEQIRELRFRELEG